MNDATGTGSMGSKHRTATAVVSSRLFVRTVRQDSPGTETPPPGAVAAWLSELDRTGRLVAAGDRVEPEGHWVLLRAETVEEARRALRSDPYVAPGASSGVEAWSIARAGTGINLDPPPARGSGRLTVLHRISVFVRDLEAALRWYQEVLGLTVRAADPATEYFELSLGAGSAGLVLVRPRAEWGRALYEEGVRRTGIATGITFQSDNVEALALRLTHAGRPPLDRPRIEPWGGRAVRFADPDGNEFVAVDVGPSAPGALPRPPRRPHRKKAEPFDRPELYPGAPSPPRNR